MKFNELEAGKIGTDDVISLYLGSEKLWPAIIAASTNYLKKLFGKNDGSTAWGDNFGYSVAISNGVVAICDPATWDDNPVPGHASEIFLYDAVGTYLRSVYVDWDAADRNNDFGQYNLAMNATHIGAGHNYGTDQYFLWDINGTLIQKIERPVDFTGTAFAGTAAMTSTKLFIGAYNSDITAGVYVYDMTATYLHKITNPDASGGFGGSIYANENYLMISSATGVHVYNSSTYAFIRTIPIGGGTIGFGFSMAQAGAYFYVCDYRQAQGIEDSIPDAGAVYMYNVADGTFHMEIQDTNPTQGGNFGYSIDVDNNYLVVGQPSRNNQVAAEGWLHVYNLDGSLVAEVRPDGDVNATYAGWSVAIENGTIVMGAWNDNEGDPDNLANTQYAGSAYLWDVTTMIAV